MYNVQYNKQKNKARIQFENIGKSGEREAALGYRGIDRIEYACIALSFVLTNASR